MSARPGQSGTVYRFRGNWIGQWLEVVWPAARIIKTTAEFDKFSDRWNRNTITMAL